ncbi:MAG: hypothetical protein CL920_00790 [Deltaproteobacteria bacterium]|nr:hypothetical protein [Deltaproteobacteria bacterium]MBU47217.1 hypothetical protein [Deltaproteobacteria bacterium]|tara:strand:+ start:8982 stop:9971 length:990 start_codon:yes stop_codon:yes gene_type:complete
MLQFLFGKKRNKRLFFPLIETRRNKPSEAPMPYPLGLAEVRIGRCEEDGWESMSRVRFGISAVVDLMTSLFLYVRNPGVFSYLLRLPEGREAPERLRGDSANLATCLALLGGERLSRLQAELIVASGELDNNTFGHMKAPDGIPEKIDAFMEFLKQCPKQRSVLILPVGAMSESVISKMDEHNLRSVQWPLETKQFTEQNRKQDPYILFFPSGQLEAFLYWLQKRRPLHPFWSPVLDVLQHFRRWVIVVLLLVLFVVLGSMTSTTLCLKTLMPTAGNMSIAREGRKQLRERIRSQCGAWCREGCRTHRRIHGSDKREQNCFKACSERTK